MESSFSTITSEVRLSPLDAPDIDCLGLNLCRSALCTDEPLINADSKLGHKRKSNE